MKRLLFILLFATFSLHVHAEPAKETSIEKLLVLTDAQKGSQNKKICYL